MMSPSDAEEKHPSMAARNLVVLGGNKIHVLGAYHL